MAGSRSPNYPQLPLPEAIEKVRGLWQKLGDRRARSPKELATALGYSDLNGAAQGVISALRKYGLLEGKQGELAISQRAIDIVELPASSGRRKQALQQAVRGYPLFAELLTAHSSTEPSDEPLRHRLVSRGFRGEAADRLIEIYKISMELLDNEGASLASVIAKATPEAGAPTAEKGGSTPQEAVASSQTPPDGEPPASNARAFDAEITYGTTSIKVHARGNGAPIAPPIISILQELIALTGRSGDPSPPG